MHYLGFGTYAGGYGSTGRRGQTGYLDASQLEIAPDGRFEMLLSSREQPGNWLRMEPDTSLVHRAPDLPGPRSTSASRSSRSSASAAAGGPQPITPELVDRGLQAAAAYVAGTRRLFADWAEGFAKRTNELPRFDPAIAAAAHGDPNIVYFHGYWELRRDEALVIEVTPPAATTGTSSSTTTGWSRSTTATTRSRSTTRRCAHARPTARCGSWWPTRPGRPELDRDRGPPPRHDVPALGGRGAAPGADDARREARGRRGFG